MKKVDYIIVGQGISGSVLSYYLMQKGQKVLVIDEEKETSSSKVAAGMCNPVVFKRLTKSWMVDELIPTMKTFFEGQESLFKQQFYYPTPIYKLFVSNDEFDFWRQKSNEPEMFDWIGHKKEFPFNKMLLDYEYGAAKTLNSGFVDVAKWLSSYKDYLIENDSFITQKFDYKKVDLPDKITYSGIESRGIIFCEGYQSINNPFFNWLPFKLTKGEVLTVNFKELKLDAAINKGAFILPFEEGYKLGATYNWDEIDENPTEKGKEELLNKAKRFINDEISVVEHKAGIRPTVLDRRPLLGMHPQKEQLFMFNGMGTKGVMIAPYFAQKMVSFLMGEEQLPEEVNIDRFKD